MWNGRLAIFWKCSNFPCKNLKYSKLDFESSYSWRRQISNLTVLLKFRGILGPLRLFYLCQVGDFWRKFFVLAFLRWDKLVHLSSSPDHSDNNWIWRHSSAHLDGQDCCLMLLRFSLILSCLIFLPRCTFYNFELNRKVFLNLSSRYFSG